MRISVYTRHADTCAKRDDTQWKRCKCPKWLYCIEWKPVPQRSAKTRSWDEAEKRARKIEAGESIEPEVTIQKGVDAYLSDMKDRNLSPDYQAKLKRELGELTEWARHRPLHYLRELGLAELGDWRRTWKGNATTRFKRQERIRSVFLYWIRHGWLKTNPAASLSRIKQEHNPTIPLTREEYARAEQCCATERTLTMLQLLRWTGLRVTDAATLERSRLTDDDKIFLYTQKTGTPVRVLIQPDLARRLRSLPNLNPKYFFWSGTSKKKSAGVRWWENLKAVFIKAGIPHAHPHALRDTFAVECLLKGVPIEQVSVLLGHSSIRVTEKSYAPWNKARQDQLEESVKKTWT
jgi:integrase/recombinase XerD